MGKTSQKIANFTLASFLIIQLMQVLKKKIVGLISAEKTWIGVKGSPMTNSLYLHSSLGRLGLGDPKDYITSAISNLGVGLSLNTDVNGPLSTYSCRLSLAYHLQIFRNLKLSIGTAGLVNYFKADSEVLKPHDANDIVITDLEHSTTKSNGQAGIRIQWNNYYSGLSILDFADHSLFQEKNELYPSYKTYCLTGGYKKDITNKLGVELNTVAYNDAYGNMAVNTKLDIKIMKTLGIAVGYSTPQSYLGYLTFSTKINNFGYGFEYSASPYYDKSYGTHLLFIGCRL